jgi:hypothetical protein
MDKENGIIFNHKEEWNYVIFMKMDENRDHHAKQTRLIKKNIAHCFSYAESGL